MLKIAAVVIAHNEDKTIHQVLSSVRAWADSITMILDNPTDSVLAVSCSVDNVVCMPKSDGEHVYKWDDILRMIERVTSVMDADWIVRVDADEVWEGIYKEIVSADSDGANVCNFKIQQHAPKLESWDGIGNLDDICRITDPSDPLHLEPNGNRYERAWKQGGKITLGGGGHVILRKDKVLYESELSFKHYPAVDFDSLKKKIKRTYAESDLKKGWHVQYNALLEQQPRKIAIFYHIAQMGSFWRDVVKEQTELLHECGLLDACDTAVCTILGSESVDLPKPFQVASQSMLLHKYEFPALDAMYAYACENPDAAILYLHTKGVSVNKDRKRQWRRYMQWGVLERWQDCISALNNFDTAGVEWYTGERQEVRGTAGFWAGNFWWSTGKHLSRLKNPVKLKRLHRWDAEAWIAKGLSESEIKPFCLHNTGSQQDKKSGMLHPEFSRSDYTTTCKPVAYLTEREKNIVKNLKTKQEIQIFYHVGMLGSWYSIFTEQMKDLRRSGLLDVADFHVCCVGTEKDFRRVLRHCDNALLIDDDIRAYEFPTLALLHDAAQKKDTGKILYIHTKGASRNGKKAILCQSWRRYMMNACVQKWDSCVSALDYGYDLAGADWTEMVGNGRKWSEDTDGFGYFAGNFWWAKNEFIKTLNKQEHSKKRLLAESWIGSGSKNPNVFEVSHLGIAYDPSVLLDQ